MREFTRIFLLKAIDNALKQVCLKEGEKVEVHQLVNVGEFNNEKIFLIILNVNSSKDRSYSTKGRFSEIRKAFFFLKRARLWVTLYYVVDSYCATTIVNIVEKNNNKCVIFWYDFSMKISAPTAKATYTLQEAMRVVLSEAENHTLHTSELVDIIYDRKLYV